MTLLERLASLKRVCLSSINTAVDTYTERKGFIQKHSAHYRRLAVFSRVISRTFPDSFVYERDWSVNVSLGTQHTISKDVMICLDDNRELLTRLGGCSEYEVENNQEAYILTYAFGDIKFMVTYGDASCSKVPVGTHLRSSDL